MSRIYLQVPFAQKRQVSQLGAKYDRLQQLWYIDASTDTTPFKPWLQVAEATYLPAELPQEVKEVTVDCGIHPQQRSHLRLSQLLQQVRRLVQQEFYQPIWVIAEVASIKKHTSGHIYLNLIERQWQSGDEIAKVQAYIWKQNRAIVNRFESHAKQQLSNAMSVLVRVHVRFNERFGFGVEITDIDANYSLGVFAQKVRLIRQQLLTDNLAKRNRQLIVQEPLQRVAVIAPYEAAAKGDFSHTIEPLMQAKLLQIDYYDALFQGDGAAKSMLKAWQVIQQVHAEFSQYDLLVVIRGGGAQSDLQFLEDFELLRQVCLSDIPVWVGIGHETDTTTLDWVAHRSFITPTALANALVELNLSPLRRALQQWQNVQLTLKSQLQWQRQKLLTYNAQRASYTHIINANRSQLRQQQHGLQQQWQHHVLLRKQMLHNTYVKLQLPLQPLKQCRLQLRQHLQQMMQQLSLRLQKEQLNLLVWVNIPKLLGLGNQYGQLQIDQRRINHALRVKLQGDYNIVQQQAKKIHRQLLQQHSRAQQQLQTLWQSVKNHDHSDILKRGYALLLNEQGMALTSIVQVREAQNLRVVMVDGQESLRIASAQENNQVH